MATVTHSGTLPDSSQKTDFYSIIDNATVTSIVNADIGAGAAIADTKLATITTSAKVNRSAITGDTGAIEAVFDGGGSAIAAGTYLDLEVPFACTVVSAKAYFDQDSQTTIDIWKDTYANFPPTSADTICSTTAFSTTGASADTLSATLTAWTTAITANDIIRVKIVGNNLPQRATIVLNYSRP